MPKLPSSRNRVPGTFAVLPLLLLFVCAPCSRLPPVFDNPSPPLAPPTREPIQTLSDLPNLPATQPPFETTEQVILQAPKTVVVHRTEGNEQEVWPEELRPVQRGDGIMVHSSGEARLTFPDTLVIRLFQNSGLDYESTSDSAATPLRRFRLFAGALVGGRTLSEHAEHRVAIEVATDWAIIRELGTQFWVYSDPNLTWVVVRSGAVTVQDTTYGATVIVEAGQQTWVPAGEAPVQPVPATRAALGEFSYLFPNMDELTQGEETEAIWLDSNSSAQPAINTPWLEPPTESSPAADDLEPLFLSELIYDPQQVFYSPCASISQWVDFQLQVQDKSPLQIFLHYQYVVNGQAVAEFRSVLMDGTAEPLRFTTSLDVGTDGFAHLKDAPGQIVYWVEAIDAFSNRAELRKVSPIEIAVAPC
jgi:hypothetical protein